MKLTTEEIMKSLNDNLVETVNSSAKDLWLQWSTDSRAENPEGLFIAIVGEKFDGHDYLEGSFEKGSEGFVISNMFYKKNRTEIEDKLRYSTLFVVTDTTTALQNIASFYRNKLDCQKVAFTGTSGKTSAKYFCHQILEGNINHYFSPRSFNNHLGVPMTLLNLKEDHNAALIEIGMNAPGEIEFLTRLAMPDITAVTMVGRGHLEGVGTIEAVLDEKMKIFGEGNTHLINIDDSRIFADYKKKFKSHLTNPKYTIIKFSSKDSSADVFMELVESKFNSFKIKGQIGGFPGKADVPIAGEHHVMNVALAASAALALGVSPEKIWEGVSRLKPVWGRSEIIEHDSGVHIYFDAYNANPESMQAFINQCSHLETPPYFILGEMLEMGEHAPSLHFELGKIVADCPHEKIWFIGPSCHSFKEGYEASGNPKS